MRETGGGGRERRLERVEGESSGEREREGGEETQRDQLHECQRCKYTTSVDIKKTRYKKKLVTHVESHASAVSLLESGE